MLTRELTHHQRVLRPLRAVVSGGGHQSFAYGPAPRTARERNKTGFGIRLVFGSSRHAVSPNTKKARDPLPVRQEPGLYHRYRNPEAHTRDRIGKVPPTPNGCTFLAIEIAKRKPGRVAGCLVATAQSIFECRNARVIEGSGFQRQVREKLSHRRFIYQTFHDAVDWNLRHQKLKES